MVSEGVRELLRENWALPSHLLMAGMLVALGAAEAGYAETDWYAVAIFAAVLLAVSAIALPGRGRLPRAVLFAQLLFGAFVAWSFLSITWADSPATAWDGANRSALYLIVFLQFSLWPSDHRGTGIFIATIGLGLATLGAVELLRADASSFSAGFFTDARLVEPVGYINGNVALWTMGLMACLGTVAMPRAPAVVRGLSLGGVYLLAAVALMGQSRGWAFALPPALLILVVMCPGRLRILTAGALAGIALAVTAGTILAVHDRFDPDTFDATLHSATVTVLVGTLVLVVVGVIWSLGDRRVDIGKRATRRTELGLALAAAVAVAGAGVALALTDSGPVDRLETAWNEFKSGGETPGPGESRFTTAGTNRYDFWTVAVDSFKDRPVGGVGADNFQAEYLRRGNSGEQPRFAHSLQLGILAQSGIVGGLLLAGALGSALAAALSLSRRGGAPAIAATAGLGVFGYWLLHASVDWFWEFPALTAIAVALLGLATATGRPRSAPVEPRRVRLSLVATVLGTFLAVLSFTFPWLAVRDVDRAASQWRDSPAQAADRLDRAEWLNPLSSRPQITAGVIAIRSKAIPAARREFREALDREPENAFAILELALIDAESGARPAAVRGLRRVLELSPRNRVARDTLDQVLTGKPVSAERVNDELLESAIPRAPGR